MIYISRDQIAANGELSPYVDIWEEKPICLVDFDGEGTCVWVSDPDEWLRNKLMICTVLECRELYGTAPDYVNELIMASAYRRPRMRAPRNA